MAQGKYCHTEKEVGTLDDKYNRDKIRTKTEDHIIKVLTSKTKENANNTFLYKRAKGQPRKDYNLHGTK